MAGSQALQTNFIIMGISRDILTYFQNKMPFKPPEVSRCPTCDRPVYAAEEKLAGGYKWHKVCFKCNMCSKFLDSTTCAEHERKLFCKTCYGRKYGPKGVGFGGGAGALCMDTGAQFGNDESQTNKPPTSVDPLNVFF